MKYNKCIKIKNLCINLVKKDYHCIRMHGEQNVKTYHLCVLIAMKYEILTFLEPSESVQACAGIALPFFLTDTTETNIL